MNYSRSFAVVTSVLGAMSLLAADQTWTGTISDSMCGATHKKMAEHGTDKMSDRACTMACVKDGGKYVLVSNGKVYKIDNQDFAALAEHAGHAVKICARAATTLRRRLCSRCTLPRRCASGTAR